MAVREIKSKLVLEGEKQYRDGLDAAYKSVSQLGRELKVAEAAYIDNADSMEAQTKKSAILRKEIDGQKDIIRSLTGRMKEIEGAYDGNTEAQELYADKVGKAMRALAKMEKELAQTEDKMRELGDASEKSADDLDRAETEVKQLGNTADKAERQVANLSGGFTVMKGVLSNLVSSALQKGGALLKDFIGDSRELASDMEEVDNVVSTAFGNQTAAIKTFADEATGKFGLSSLAAQNYAGKLGAAFNAMGLNEHAMEMSTTLTGLSGDLASFWNMSSDETYAKLFSGVISGETEGLKALGIVMNETNLNAFAMSEGIKKGTKGMSEADKAMLRYRYVLNATSQAQGDFAKTSGSYANQSRIAQLSLDNLRAALGAKLLPVITAAMQKLNAWMQSDYAKNLFEKMGVAIASLAETVLPALMDGFTWIVEHLNDIAAIIEIIGIGYLTTKLVGMSMGLINLVRGLNASAKSMGLLNAVMSMNPAVVIGIAVAALAAGLIGLANSYESLSDKLDSIKLNVPQTSVDAVTDGINAGIEAADKEHEIKLKVKVDTTDLKESLTGIFSDGKITSKEKRGNLKAVKGSMSEDLKTAESGAIGDMGLVLADDLKDAYAEYSTLLNTIYTERRSATAEELEELEAVLEKIGVLRGKIQAAQDESLVVQRGTFARVMQGYGTEEDFGTAVGYVQQTWANEMLTAQDDYNTKISEINTKIAEGTLTAKEGQITIDALTGDYETKTSELKTNQQNQLQALLDSYSKSNPEAMAAIENFASLRDAYAEMFSSMVNADTLQEKAKVVLSKENIEKFLPDANFTESDVQAAIDRNDLDWIETWMTQMQIAMEEEIDTASAGITDNPVLGWVQAMLDSGSFDTLDITKLDGGLANSFKAIDLLQRGKDVGKDLVPGINAGIGKSVDGMTADDHTALRDKMIETMREAFDSHSPARVMYPLGEDIVGGLAAGMDTNTSLRQLKIAGTGATEAIASGIRSRKSLITMRSNELMEAARDVVKGYRNNSPPPAGTS